MSEFGLIGHPVAHSMSRLMHEAAFKELGLKHEYGLYDVAEDKLGQFMAEADFSGLNVTIPHKVAVIRFLDELSPEAKLIGSVNTIEFGGKRTGHNTDAVGFMMSLKDAGVKVRGRRFLVLGAGGGGRGIVFKLAMEGANVYCHARNPQKSGLLADEVFAKTGKKVETPQKVEDVIREVDVVVNATPVGMHPNTSETILAKELLHPGLTVVDIVYNPIETRLLRDARLAGCKTVDGVGMLAHQGSESLRIWLGIEPPTDVMRAAVSSFLAGRG